MKANEQAETFIDRYSSSFEEYLSSVVNKLRDTDSEYKDIEERIAKLYEDYPRVKAVFDLESKGCFRLGASCCAVRTGL